jgi:hypothetical protein
LFGALDPRSGLFGFGVAPYALDSEDASRLWDLSLDLINVRY